MGVRRYTILVVLAVLGVVYVLPGPGHPRPGHAEPFDVLAHIGFFLVCSVALVWALRGRRVVLLVPLVLAWLLEFVQWRVVGFSHLEWGDVVSNEVGVVLAWMAVTWLLWWMRRRGAHG